MSGDESTKPKCRHSLRTNIGQPLKLYGSWYFGKYRRAVNFPGDARGALSEPGMAVCDVTHGSDVVRGPVETTGVNQHYAGSTSVSKAAAIAQQKKTEREMNRVKKRILALGKARIDEENEYPLDFPDIALRCLSVCGDHAETDAPPTDEPSQVQETGHVSPVDRLTDAFVRAMQEMVKHQPVGTGTGGERMDKFIARQSVAKDLPMYDGRPDEWPNFISQFRGSTEMCGFSEAENMYRLQKALKGKARDTVQAMMVAPENLNRVIETLELRFGRPDYIINSLIGKAKTFPSLREDKFEALIEFANSVQNIVLTMESLKRTGHMTNPQLMENLVEKLPPHLRFEWGKFVAQRHGDVDLKDLSEWLTESANAASYVSIPHDHVDEKHRGFEKKRHSRSSGRDAVLTVYNTEKKATAEQCIFCGHLDHNVKTVSSLKDVTKLEDENGQENKGFVSPVCKAGTSWDSATKRANVD